MYIWLTQYSSVGNFRQLLGSWHGVKVPELPNLAGDHRINVPLRATYIKGPPTLCAYPTGAGAVAFSVPKLHVRPLFGHVRPWTWRFEGFLDQTIIIF